MLFLVNSEASVEFLYELAISYQIFRILMSLFIIEIHQPLKIDQKPILVDYNFGKRLRDGLEQPLHFLGIIKNHNYYLMIARQIIKAGNNLNAIISYNFSTPFFSKAESAEPVVEKKEEIRFSGKIQEKSTRENKRENLQALVNKINEANKYFLGVKLNTNYLKVNKALQYEDIAKLTIEKAHVNEIPIEISKKQAENDIFEKLNQEEALQQKSGQIAFSKARLEPTIKQMQQIIQKFIISIGKKSRMTKVEPNFELQCIKALNSLDSKLQLNLENQKAEPQIKIKSITLLKGLTAYRNDNYSTDSFEKNEQELSEGIISYKLYRQLKEEYPEVEWYSTKRINARFQLLVRGGPSIQILESGNKIGSTANTIHNVVIETDLIPPPPHAESLLSAQQYLRSYRLDYNSLILTNFDRKNQFYALTYTQAEKKSNLVNRIV